MDGFKADTFLARELIMTGMPISPLLDELHPEAVVLGLTVERLVRPMVVLE